jgi:hypothetical protein
MHNVREAGFMEKRDLKENFIGPPECTMRENPGTHKTVKALNGHIIQGNEHMNGHYLQRCSAQTPLPKKLDRFRFKILIVEPVISADMLGLSMREILVIKG